MRVSRGKASNIAVISKFLNSFFNSSQTRIPNGSTFPILMKFHLFSSLGSHSFNGQFRNYGNYGYNGRNYDDYENDNNYNSRFSENNGRNVSTQKNFRASRGERQMPQFQEKNDYSGSNYQRRGRSDGYRKPFNDDDDGNRTNMKLDDSFKFDGNDEDSRVVNLGKDQEGKVGSQPSVSELLSKTSRENQSKKDGDFLEKFKLNEVNKEESEKGEGTFEVPSQEEKMEEPQNADEIFKKMKQSGLIPNAVAMLDGLCKDGLVQEAMKLFGLMREKGSMPEVVVYTAVVEGFCQAQQFDDAKRIFRKMENNGIVPNAFSYSVLIKGLCKGNRLDDAIDFCSEMLENGHSPNVVTFVGLVHGFCNERGVEDARSVILKLKQKGFLLDEKAVRTYLDKNGPKSALVWEAIFGPKKTSHNPI